MSEVAELKVLLQADFPTGTVRLWSGSGPYIDADGYVWRACVLADEGLEAIEASINGEAVTLPLSIIGVDPEIANIAWQENEAGDVIDSTIKAMLQDIDAAGDPIGDPEVHFTGRIDNILFDDAASEDGVTSNVTIEAVNRFDLRTLTSGAVLSDVDQKARSAILNPGANADRFCERVDQMADVTINWPNW